MAMWGRKDQDDPPTTSSTPKSFVTQPTAQAAPKRGTSMENRKANIGPSIQIKGELIGNEDLLIEGRVEGNIRLKEHQLTVGQKADIHATLEAKSIRIEGTVNGDVMAGDRVELASGSALIGDIVAPRIVISDGARFKGSVDMDSGSSGSSSSSSSSVKSSTESKSELKPAGVSS